MRMQGRAGSVLRFAGIHFRLPQTLVGVTTIFKAAPQPFYTTQSNGQGQLLQTIRPLLPVIFASFAEVCPSQHFRHPQLCSASCMYMYAYAMYMLEDCCLRSASRAAQYLQHMQAAYEHPDNH